MMETIMFDTRSVTGRNLRHLKLMTENWDESEIDVYRNPYSAIPVGEEWRVSFLQELMNAMKTGPLDEKRNMNEICDYVCES